MCAVPASPNCLQVGVDRACRRQATSARDEATGALPRSCAPTNAVLRPMPTIASAKSLAASPYRARRAFRVLVDPPPQCLLRWDCSFRRCTCPDPVPCCIRGKLDVRMGAWNVPDKSDSHRVYRPGRCGLPDVAMLTCRRRKLAADGVLLPRRAARRASPHSRFQRCHSAVVGNHRERMANAPACPSSPLPKSTVTMRRRAHNAVASSVKCPFAAGRLLEGAARLGSEAIAAPFTDPLDVFTQIIPDPS